MRVCLGKEAISSKKSECGNPLVILGVQMKLSDRGMHMFPAPEKVQGWIIRLEHALATGLMSSGEASKLAGAPTCFLNICLKSLPSICAYWSTLKIMACICI